MREQRQISPRSLPHSFSSNCCGSGTARTALLGYAIRGEIGKSMYAELPVGRQLSPFLQGIHRRTQGEQTRELFFLRSSLDSWPAVLILERKLRLGSSTGPPARCSY